MLITYLILGDHADFQVQFEIGPQKDTKAIGTSSSSKREVQTGSEFPAKRIKSEEKVKIFNSLLIDEKSILIFMCRRHWKPQNQGLGSKTGLESCEKMTNCRKRRNLLQAQ